MSAFSRRRAARAGTSRSHGAAVRRFFHPSQEET